MADSTPGDPGSTPDWSAMSEWEISKSVWEVVAPAIVAAFEGDAQAHLSALRRFDSEMPIPRAFAYVYLLLRFVVRERYVHTPDADDLARCAHHAFADWERLINLSEDRLVDLLQSAFELVPDERRVLSNEFIVLGTAAIGVLSSDPGADFVRFGPVIEEWWRREGGDLTAETT